MSSARAPGKVVLSGAYSVLEGAPALCAAVDRYVVADAARPADRVTEEVAAAIAAGALSTAPWFDASALRQDGQKLGLGSSAAILVASLAAASLGDDRRDEDEEALRQRILLPALAAHRAAQGGGSGVDVAASVYGGVVLCRLLPGGALDVRPHALPPGVVVEVFASRVAASTRDLLGQVRAFAALEPSSYRRHMDRASAGAEAGAGARSAAELVRAFADQVGALGALGDAAAAPIVTAEVAALAEAAAKEGGAFGPSGAGGGDVALFFGERAPSAELLLAARGHGLEPLALRVGARGVHEGRPTG